MLYLLPSPPSLFPLPSLPSLCLFISRRQVYGLGYIVWGLVFAARVFTSVALFSSQLGWSLLRCVAEAKASVTLVSLCFCPHRMRSTVCCAAERACFAALL